MRANSSEKTKFFKANFARELVCVGPEKEPWCKKDTYIYIIVKKMLQRSPGQPPAARTHELQKYLCAVCSDGTFRELRPSLIVRLPKRSCNSHPWRRDLRQGVPGRPKQTQHGRLWAEQATENWELPTQKKSCKPSMWSRPLSGGRKHVIDHHCGRKVCTIASSAVTKMQGAAHQSIPGPQVNQTLEEANFSYSRNWWKAPRHVNRVGHSGKWACAKR